jgi:hypothetical protein
VQIERVQRWVMSSLRLLVGSMLALGMVLGALLVIERERTGAQVGLIVLATVVSAITVGAVRLVNERSLVTPWLVCALAPLAVGLSVLQTR